MTSTQRCTGVLGLLIATAIAVPAARAQPTAEAMNMEQVAQLDLGMIAVPAARAQPTAEAMNMEQVAQLDLGGKGDGGEGLALQQRKDGRRVLYLAHEGQKTCLSVVDVTNPKAPALIAQLPSPGPAVTRCNSLGLAGNVLAIANQTLK